MPPRSRSAGQGSSDYYNTFRQITSATWEDPGALTSANSIGVDGISITMAASATVVDGYRENIPRYRRPLLELVPDFDPNLDVIELLLTNISCPTDGGSLCGIGLGIVDSATLASGDGEFYTVRDLSLNSQRIHRLGATAQTAFVSPTTSIINKLLVRLNWSSSSARIMQGLCMYQRNGNGYWEYAELSPPGYPSVSDGDYQVIFGTWRNSGGDGSADTLSGIPYIRRTRVGSLP